MAGEKLLQDKTALVTGGGTGIGKGCAAVLADAGARVTICGPDTAVLEAAAEALRNENPERQLVTVHCDVTEEALVAEAVKIAANGGALDIALANAGTGFPGSLLHLEKEHWMVPIGINLLGTAFTLKHAALNMKAHGGGSIITMSSVASERQTKYMAAYGVSKAAIDELTRSAAAELGEFGIRVNGIRPGFIQTDAVMGSTGQDNIDKARRETVLGRLGTEADVARAALYFASSQSEWVTGQMLAVCGGFTLYPESMNCEAMARMLFPEQMTRDFGPAQ
ncbi:MAG: SDR family oxidoreductase [Gammaproteobacteria bacterium]|nr:SDR family oxidoreductase [Gammaproteobacteria bacterium]